MITLGKKSFNKSNDNSSTGANDWSSCNGPDEDECTICNSADNRILIGHKCVC